MTTYYPSIGSSGNRIKPLYGYGPFISYGYMPVASRPYMHPYSHHPLTGSNNYSYTSQAHAGDNIYSKVPEVPVAPAEAPGASEVSGGITAVMEYESQSMAAFLSWCALGMLKQGRNPSIEFEQAIVSILNATRLPKLTILIALEYINQRFPNRETSLLNDNEVFTFIVIALVLANKFNDDNTFTNRSWCGATGLQIEVVNKEEALWLKAVNWNLNVVGFRSNLECLDECWLAWLRRFSGQGMFSPPVTPPYSPSYSTSYYSSYSAYSPSSPSYEYGVEQASLVSSPICESPSRFNYDWQVSQCNWGYGHNGAVYRAPLVPPHILLNTASQFSGDSHGYVPTYYNCMASC